MVRKVRKQNKIKPRRACNGYRACEGGSYQFREGRGKEGEGLKKKTRRLHWSDRDRRNRVAEGERRSSGRRRSRETER